MSCAVLGTTWKVDVVNYLYCLNRVEEIQDVLRNAIPVREFISQSQNGVGAHNRIRRMFRRVQYVHWVMHKCIMVKVGGKRNTRKVCKKQMNLSKTEGKICQNRRK